MTGHDGNRPLESGANRLWLLVLLLLLALTILNTWQFWPRSAWNGLDPNAVPRAITARGDLADDEKTTIKIFSQASPSVVHITTLTLRQDALSLDVLQIPRGTGSGFIWDQKGHVVTNYHVIQDADAAKVTLADHSTWTARLVGAFPDKDLAVLVIDAPKDRMRPIPIGTSHDLQVGQKVLAIGNPFGLDQTLTTGVISALGRQIESVNKRAIKDMIQTDAAINPGNSGGPLLDSAGRLIGVNTAIFSPSGAYAGIGFAIPVDEVNRVVPHLIKHGKVARAGLGIQMAPDALARQIGVKGVLILDVQANGPAAEAGLRPTRRDEMNRILLGDVITAVDGRAVGSVNELLEIIDEHQPGSVVTLTIRRNAQEMQAKVTLAAI